MNWQTGKKAGGRWDENCGRREFQEAGRRQAITSSKAKRSRKLKTGKSLSVSFLEFHFISNIIHSLISIN